MKINDKYIFVVLSCAFILLASCTGSTEPKGNGFPAKALERSSAVYYDFKKMLDAERKDTEPARFAADMINYDVFISEDGRGFIYTFQLKPFHGHAVLDGRVTYLVSGDGSVKRVGVL
jgi:hypothetical protein